MSHIGFGCLALPCLLACRTTDTRHEAQFCSPLQPCKRRGCRWCARRAWVATRRRAVGATVSRSAFCSYSLRSIRRTYLGARRFAECISARPATARQSWTLSRRLRRAATALSPLACCHLKACCWGRLRFHRLPWTSLSCEEPHTAQFVLANSAGVWFAPCCESCVDGKQVPYTLVDVPTKTAAGGRAAQHCMYPPAAGFHPPSVPVRRPALS